MVEPDRLIHVSVTWDQGPLLWSRSDAPGPRAWEGELPSSIADALDRVIAAVQAVRTVTYRPDKKFGFALVEVM